MADREEFATAVGALVKGVRVGTALGTEHLDTVTGPGQYRQSSASRVTIEQGYPVAGTVCTLAVDLWGASGSSNVVQTITYARGEGTWVRSYYSSTWQQWVKIGADGGAVDAYTKTEADDKITAAVVGRTVGAAGVSHLDSLTVPGRYRQSSVSSVTLALGYPVAALPCSINVDLWGSSGSTNVIQTVKYPTPDGGVWSRGRYSGIWQAWQQVASTSAVTALTQRVDAIENAGGGGGGDATGPAGASHAARIARARQMVGARTSTRAQVALIFDHGTVKFRDLVWPALQAHGLTCTLALNSAKMPGGYLHDAVNEVDSWDTVKAWASAGVELANHGRTHQDTDSLATLHAEIVTGREELEAASGSTIHSFVQPAASGDLGKWFGFDDGLRWSGYTDLYAGKLILDQHAIATGQIYPKGSYQMTGEPPIGAQGFWLDRDDQIPTAQAEVTTAADQKRGVLLRMHPQYVGGQNTMAALDVFFGWLAAEKAAGRIDVVTLAQWGLTRIEPATPGSTGPDTGWRNITSLLGPAVESGRLLLRRKGDETTVIFDDLALTEAHTNLALPRIGVGFRPRFARARGEWITSTSYTMGGTAAITASGYFNAYSLPASTPLSMRFVFDATGAFPTAPPGDPA